MATVTKLKAEVNNKNLPILGKDGNLYNYYCGRFVNKLLNYGVTPTLTERNALNAFIQNGIDNGWIEKVVYLLPFIGNSSNPLSGLVPLVDNVADYEISADSVNADAFTYNQDGTIKTLGNPNYSIPVIPLPITNDNMGGGMSLFMNKTYYNDEPTMSTVKCVVQIEKNNDIYFRFGIGYSTSNSLYNVVKQYRQNDELKNYSKINGSDFSSGNIGVFYAYYRDEDECKFKRYARLKGSDDPAQSMVGTLSDSTFDYVSDCKAVLSSSNVSLLYRVNMVAAFDPLTVNKADMDNFNTAVFTLMTALGRDIPTT